jgi:sugar phosphate isomerase/epimerase
MRLGIGSYTYVWAIGVPGYPAPQHPMTVEELLERAAELGVHVVQIADNLPLHQLESTRVADLLRRANDLGIALELGTCGIDPQGLRAYLDLCQRLHSPILRTLLDTDIHYPTPDEAARTLAEVMPDFERAGVCLAIENHDRFRSAALLEILDRIGSDHIGICLDTANSIGCIEDIDTVVAILGPRTVNLHLKDFRIARPPHKKGFVVEGCPAGQGRLDVPILLAKLRATGRDMNVILELWPPPEATITESIAKEAAWARESIRYLRPLVPDPVQ